jgi:hypothetical protein
MKIFILEQKPPCQKDVSYVGCDASRYAVACCMNWETSLVSFSRI